MKSKIIEDADVVTYVVVCDQGDQAVATLQQFAQDEDLEASRITGVGGFERATVGWFDRAAKRFRHIQIDEPTEVLSLIGDIAESPDGPQPEPARRARPVRWHHPRRPPHRGARVPHPGGHYHRGPRRAAQGDAPGPWRRAY